MREMYTEVINSGGYDIISCKTPQEGLKLVLKEKPSAIITSTNKLEATWLIERLRREKDPKISSIPILVILEEGTGNNSEYIEIGATRCLPKFPESGEKLLLEIRKIINIPRFTFS